MPGIPKCVWEWDGDKWVMKSGQAGCPIPQAGGRPEKGETMETTCPEPEGN